MSFPGISKAQPGKEIGEEKRREQQYYRDKQRGEEQIDI
jgi:hypothetical protein